MADLFADASDFRKKTQAAASAPQVGMGFHEMYSWWVFVTAVTEHTVQFVSGGGHPSWFPECGTARVMPLDEFPTFVRFAEVVERRYSVDGWAAAAEGLTKDQLEQRLRRGGQRAGRG